MRAIHYRSCLLLLVLALTGACNDDLPKATSIVHMRVLGARTEVIGDAERSTPRPGEAASIGWALVFPTLEQGPSELASMFISCTAPTQFTGIPICQEFIDAAQSPDEGVAAMLGNAAMDRVSCKDTPDAAFTVGSLGAACVQGAPKMSVEIEDDTKVKKKLVRGIICRNGIPALDPKEPQLFVCDPKKGVSKDEREEIAVYGTIAIAYEAGDENTSPSLDDVMLMRGGKDWLGDEQALADEDGGVAMSDGGVAPLPVTDDDCLDAANAEQLHKSDGRAEVIKLAFPAKAREKVDGELETLEFSAYATAGEMSQRFIVFDEDADVSGGLLKDEWGWKLSRKEREEIGSGGKLVRFFFTVLDRRGGFAVAQRSLCVQR